MVLRLENGNGVVQFIAKEECKSCATSHQCMEGGAKTRTLRVRNAIGAVPGDTVEVTIDPGKFIVSAFLLWIVPVLSLITGYLIVFRSIQSESAAIVGGLVFMVITFFLLKFLDSQILKKQWLLPVITRVIKG